METETDDIPPKTHKVKIRLGNAEFEAEGDPEMVADQWAQFLAVVEKIPQAAATPVAAAPSGFPPGPQAPAVTAQEAAPAMHESGLSDDVVNRVFRREKNGITLAALPRGDSGDADALVLLVYGFQKILNRTPVSGTALVRAARQSGIQVVRPDRMLARLQDYVLLAGSRKGRVYSLNNRGLAHAENVARKVFA